MSKKWTAKVSPDCRLVEVRVGLKGHQERLFHTSFVLDIGTEATIIDRRLALQLGLTEDRSEGPSRFVGPTGPDLGYKVRVPRMSVLGQDLPEFLLRCHRLCSDAGVDGLVGLDIIRKGELNLNLPWGLVSFEWNWRLPF